MPGLRLSVDELRGVADVLAGGPDAAFQYRAHVELGGDAPDVEIAGLVRE